MHPHTIVEAFDPMDDIESGLGSAVISELISTLTFNVLKKLSIGALSQQFALRLID